MSADSQPRHGAGGRTAKQPLARLMAGVRGYTITPQQYTRVAYVALGALTLIVMTGAAVRLSGSGLGCPDWPSCYGKGYPPLRSHAIIEFSNRTLTVPVSIAAIAAWVLAYRRRPFRRDLARLGLLLPLGVVGQAVLGGLTVDGKLAYGWVMGHFALSMLLLVAAWTLVWRASHEPSKRVAARARVPRLSQAVPARGAAERARDDDSGPDVQNGPQRDRWLLWGARALVGLGALTIFAGTAATAAGPHAGGEPGQRISRLDFEGRGTMDFVIHRHSEVAILFGLVAVGLWAWARYFRSSPDVQRALTVVCLLIAAQGVVGAVQYETHLPTELVWVHVTMACLVWIAALWVNSAVGASQSPAALEPVDRPPMPSAAAVDRMGAHEGVMSTPHAPASA